MIKSHLTRFPRVCAFAVDSKIKTKQKQEKWKTKPATVEPGYNPGGGGGGTPLFGLYRYVRPQRVWFCSRFGHK